MNSGGLFNSTILDVGVGLLFVYLLFSIICTTVNEWIAGIFDTRSKNLESAIKQLLDGQGGPDAKTEQPNSDADWFLKQFYEHPLIKGINRFGKSGYGHPSYIASRTFATAVMDIATPGHSGAISFQELEEGIKTGLPEGDVKKTLLAVIQNADEDIAKAQKNIEDWYDDTMQRVGGWYKRRTQVWTFCIAAVLAVSANADTIKIVHILWTNPTVRAKIVASASNPPQPGLSQAGATNSATGAGGNGGNAATPASNPPQPASTQPGTSNPATKGGGTGGNAGTPPPNPVGNPASTSDANAKPNVLSPEERDELADMLGWPSTKQLQAEHTEDWLRRILGWLLTIVAVSLGAPFWFDLLNKIVNLRNSGPKPKTAQQREEAAAR
jgi:hypothetical protein